MTICYAENAEFSISIPEMISDIEIENSAFLA